MRIKEGLTKISRAKGSLLKRAKKVDSDTTMQIETSAKKLDILKQELHKCQLQLTGLYTALAANEKAEAALLNNQSATSELRADSDEPPPSPNRVSVTKEVVKLSILDPVTKTDFIKFFIVPKEENVRGLIAHVIVKLKLDGLEDDYQIMSKSEEGDLQLRMEDPVVQESADFMLHLVHKPKSV